MSAQQIFRLRNPALLMALAAAFPVLSYAASAANVDFAVGSVTAVNAVGVQRPLTKGAEIGNGDTIRTGDGGRAQVRFSDGAMVSLQPQTDFRIDDYQYSGKVDGREKGFFSLLKGGLRTITGWVGRSNRDSYKVTTSVATIGIRGTEYSAALGAGGGELVVNTGEGLIQVCNAAGCMLLASGESGVVSGVNNNPQRSGSRPLLSPAQPSGSTQAVFSTSETRIPDGTINLTPLTGHPPSYYVTEPPLPSPSPITPLQPLPPPEPAPPPAPALPPPLLSGPNYAVAYAALNDYYATPGFAIIDVMGSVTATFSAANELISFVDGSGDYAATAIAGAFSVDGVIGWGRWSSGSWTASSSSLADFHYVSGIPTPAGDLTALGGLTATYNLIGFTFPTAQDGTVGQAPSGTLIANFGGGVLVDSTVSLNLTVPIGGQTLSINGGASWMSASMPQTFSFNTACAAVNGFFAGANASHAGITYQIDSGAAMGFVSGAAAFKR